MHVALCGPVWPSAFEGLLYKEAPVADIAGGGPIASLALGLVERGITVTVATSAPEIRQPMDFLGRRLSLRIVPYRSRARHRAIDMFKQERRQLAEQLRAANPDIVHAHWTYEYALAALKVDADALITAHDSPMDILRLHKDRYRLLRTAMAIYTRRKTRNLAVVSPYLKERWRKHFFWRSNISILPNVAPVQRWRHEALAQRAVNAVVIATGDPVKNVETLLKAWPAILREEPQLKLELIGPGLGNDDDLAKRYREALSNVSYRGPISPSRVVDALGGADLLIHPALVESHPMAVMEAMASGVPVIGGAESGGVPWTLENGKSGILCDVTSSRDLANNVIAASRDPDRRANYIKNAREYLENNFGVEEVVEAHIRLYRSNLRQRVARSGGRFE